MGGLYDGTPPEHHMPAYTLILITNCYQNIRLFKTNAQQSKPYKHTATITATPLHSTLQVITIDVHCVLLFGVTDTCYKRTNACGVCYHCFAVITIVCVV